MFICLHFLVNLKRSLGRYVFKIKTKQNHTEFTLEYAVSKENHVKELPKKKSKRKLLRGVGDVKKSSIKTVEQIRIQIGQQKDFTEENLRRLGVLSKTVLKDDEVTKIFKRAKRSDKEPEIVKPEETTVFTEEDFAMFEREYFVD